MQKAKSFTSIAFEQKRKASLSARKNSPTRQTRPKPEWNDHLTDPNRFKVSEDDLLKKKKLLISKNNILLPEYQPMRVKPTSVSSSRSVDRHATTVSPKKMSTSPATSTRSPPSSQEEKAAPAVPHIRSEKVSSLDLLTSHSSDEDDEDAGSSDSSDDEEDENEFSGRYNKEDASAAQLDSDQEEMTHRRKSASYDMRKRAKKSKKRASSASNKATPSPANHTTEDFRPRSTWGAASRSSLVIVTPDMAAPVTPVIKKVSPVKATQQDIVYSPLPTMNSRNATPSYPSHTAKFIEKADRIADEDLLDIATNIDHLQQELRMYEEVAGKKSILDAEELQLILGNDEYGTMNIEKLNQKTVIRYLVSLVCQTMTYTLQSEVKQHHLENEIQSMQSKLDDVLRAVQQQQQTTSAYSRYVLSAPALVTPPPPPLSYQTPNARPTEQQQEAEDEAYYKTLIQQTPKTPQTPFLAAASAAVEETNTSTVAADPGMFYGTSTSDWLFMHQQKKTSPQHTPATAMTTTKASSQQSPIRNYNSDHLAHDAYQTPTSAYEYQMSPETAADLATRTYDLYLQQHQQQQQQTQVQAEQQESAGNDLDHYDEMIDRLSYQFSATNTSNKRSNTKDNGMQQEGVSLVAMPNMAVPTPAKPSPHPFAQSGNDQNVSHQQWAKKHLFPMSPPAAKKIYDASLGNYSLVDVYED